MCDQNWMREKSQFYTAHQQLAGWFHFRRRKTKVIPIYHLAKEYKKKKNENFFQYTYVCIRDCSRGLESRGSSNSFSKFVDEIRMRTAYFVGSRMRQGRELKKFYEDWKQLFEDSWMRLKWLQIAPNFNPRPSILRILDDCPKNSS